MRQILNDLLCVLTLSPIMGIGMYAVLAENPVQSTVSRDAAAVAAVYEGEAVRECAHSLLRDAYTHGDPTPAVVNAAYAQCR